MEKHQCVVNYSEIKLKGKNRKFFEKKLRENIEYALRKNNVKFRLCSDFGKIKLLELKSEDIEKTKKILSDIPGISTFYFPIIIERKNYERDIFEIISNHVKEIQFKTFAVRCKRVDKKFPMTSQDFNIKLGSIISSSGYKVDLENPDLEINVIIYEREFHIFFKKEYGLYGLPIGTSGKLVSLLSGGIDSPVASKLMAIRGGKIIYVHFHNETADSCSVKNKIIELVKKINENSPPTTLYMVPFGKLQKEIIGLCPSKYRMILYRRSMFRIASAICEKINAKGIITGDSLGQVASQTIENLMTIYESSKYPIFSPLMGLNKIEIVEKSRKFGLYEISILPYDDCCSFLISKHPETKARIDMIKDIEGKIQLEELELNTLENSEIVEIL